MTKKIYVACASFVAVLLVFVFAGPAETAAHQREQHKSVHHVRRHAAKARKRVRRKPVSYVCPMHPDMRSKSRGECPKCGMALVVERRKRS